MGFSSYLPFPGSFSHHTENFKMFQLFDLKNKVYFCVSGIRDISSFEHLGKMGTMVGTKENGKVGR